MFNSLEEEVNFFALSDELKVKVDEIVPGEKILIIDNFYKNPDNIRKLALSIQPTFNPRIVSGVPGSRIDVPYYLSFLSEVFDKLINDIYYPDTKKYKTLPSMLNATFCVNIITDTSNLPSTVPHKDGNSGGEFACGIFLTLPEDCVGGTSFYTYKDNISPDNYPDDDELSLDRYPGYLLDDEIDFKKIYLAEMKYNRMILYKRDLLHTAYVPPNSFTKDKPRLMQMFFI